MDLGEQQLHTLPNETWLHFRTCWSWSRFALCLHSTASQSTIGVNVPTAHDRAICQTHRSQTRPFSWSRSQIVQSGYFQSHKY